MMRNYVKKNESDCSDRSNSMDSMRERFWSVAGGSIYHYPPSRSKQKAGDYRNNCVSNTDVNVKFSKSLISYHYNTKLMEDE